LLQRSKAVVEPDLLGREEKIIWVEMTLLQKKWYKALYEQNYAKLANIGGEAATKNSLMNISMELRKCCNHPYLLKVRKTPNITIRGRP
jgi:SNF2 family DNA or RNA helicase